MHRRAAPGWYPDQAGRAPLRWWDGGRWTPWESDGVRVWSAQDRPSAVAPEDLDSLRFVEDVFLPEARRRGVVAEPASRALAGLVRELAREARGERPTVHASAPSPAAAAPSSSAPLSFAAPSPPYATVPAVPTTPAAPASSASPGRAARWWAGARGRLDADLTVHGLAYLGVLLLFVGVFGLVAFAFGDVTPALRPVAELAVAVVPFVAAWVLARSGARFVARTLVAVGGLLLPVMVVTSTVDGFGFPPDLHGYALPAVTGLLCAVLAAGYAAWTSRRPGSGLGVMVAPVLWFAAGMGAVGLARPVPRGEDVAVPGGAQVAVLALAVLATTAVARSLGSPERRPLVAGALAAAGPGTVVVAVLALVAGAAEGWPVLPVVVTAAALAGAVALAGRFGPTTADVALLVGWAVVTVRLLTAGEHAPLLSADLPLAGVAGSVRGWLLLAAVAGGVLLAELVTRRMLTAPDDRASGPGMPAAVNDPAGRRGTVLSILVWALTLLLATHLPLAGPVTHRWWPVAGAALLALWAAARRPRVPGGTPAGVGVDAAAATAPVLLVLGTWGMVPGEVALLTGAALVLGAVPLARGALGRTATDRFWLWWSAAAGGVVLAGTVLAFLVDRVDPASPLDEAVVPLAAALVGAAALGWPLRPVVSVAVTTPVAWWVWITACLAAGAPTPVIPIGLAVAALAAVVVGHLLRRPGRRVGSPLPAALGSAGHVTAGVAVVLTLAHGWEVVVALACATAGWAVTAVLGGRGRSPVGAVLDRGGDPGRLAPWAVTLVGLPATAWAALHVSALLPVDHPWTTAVLMATAVAYAALTRVVRAGRVRVLLPWAAFTAALLAPLLSWTTWPLVAALTALVLQVLLTRDRPAVMVWTGWAALTPVVGLTVRSALPAVGDLGGAAVLAGTTTGLGAVLTVGSLLADRARPSDPRRLPRREAAVPPAVLGAIQIALGLVVVTAVPDPSVAGVLLLAAAAAVGAVAALSGIGGVGALAVLLAWLATMPLLGRDHPGAWAHVVVAVGMLAVAQGISVTRSPRAPWARWDVPLAVAACVPALAGVAVVRGPGRPLLLTVVGVLAVASAVRLRRRPVLSEVLGWIGTTLVLLAAAGAGPGWTALALAVLAAAHTALAAVRERGSVRTIRQWIGSLAGGAAWAVLLVALAPAHQTATELTAVVGAVVVLAVVGAGAAGRLGRSWLGPWGTVGTALGLAGALRLLPDPGVLAREWDPDVSTVERALASVGAAGVGPSWWHVAAWLLLAWAALLAVRAVPWAWWRETAVVGAIGALLTGFGATGASRLAQVTSEVAVSAGAAVVLVLAARAARGRPAAAAWLRPLVVLGASAVALAAVTVLADGTPSGLLVAGVLAAAAVHLAAVGVAWRVLGLRMAAPVVAWVAWALYAVDSLTDVVAWYTVPVGLALLVVVAVWRADRGDRGLAPADSGVVALELTGIAFLVVASFVAAFTQSVGHALIASGIGVAVALWGLLTRVRRRFVAGVAVVLAGVVLAVALPLVALLPAWGEAGAWVLVAGVGLLAVLAATLLERGRAAVRDGRERLLDVTAGWE